jgi:hypothetical protein
MCCTPLKYNNKCWWTKHNPLLGSCCPGWLRHGEVYIRELPQRQHHASWSDRMEAACAATSATRGRAAGSVSKQAATSCLTLAGQPDAASSGQLSRPRGGGGETCVKNCHQRCRQTGT